MARYWDCGGLIACLCCACFSLSLFVLMPVMVSLYAYPSSPYFSIDLFNNQGFNMTRADHDSPNNLTIHFHLRLKNRNSAIGLHYPDPVNITFSYFPNVSMMVTLANYKVDSFYQGNGKTKHVTDLVETNGVATVLEGTDMIAFRVDLTATYKHKKVGSKRHKMEVGCVVCVNYTTSQKLRSGFIRLREPGLDSKLKRPSYNNNNNYGYGVGFGGGGGVGVGSTGSGAGRY